MTTTKKTTAKKSLEGSKKNLKKSKRVLVQAQGDQCFWANNGAIIGTLIELSNFLSSVPPDTFKHHVNRQKNDFADWVEFVLGDAELATTLRSAHAPKTARTYVERRLKIYDI